MKRVGLFNVRVLRKGERYGLRDCLTHDDSRPVIEFYDSRYAGEAFGPRGQFVSRYYFETLTQREVCGDMIGGLLLDTGSPDWRLTAAELAESLHYARVELG